MTIFTKRAASRGASAREPAPMMVTILAFFLTLGVLIVVHEYGHYRVAVACGVKVLRFSVGFGRVLWRRQPRPDGTEFVVCALPFGGYVRMLDEREGDVARRRARPRLQPQAALAARGRSSPPGRSPTSRSRSPCTRRRTGSASTSRRRCSARRPAASVAEKAGMRAGDWVRAWSQDGGEWHDVRSLTDLRWQVTQAMLHGEDIDLLVSGRDGRGQRRAHLALSTLSRRRRRRQDDAAHRPRQSRGASRCSATSRPAAPALRRA